MWWDLLTTNREVDVLPGPFCVHVSMCLLLGEIHSSLCRRHGDGRKGRGISPESEGWAGNQVQDQGSWKAQVLPWDDHSPESGGAKYLDGTTWLYNQTAGEARNEWMQACGYTSRSWNSPHNIEWEERLWINSSTSRLLEVSCTCQCTCVRDLT